MTIPGTLPSTTRALNQAKAAGYLARLDQKINTTDRQPSSSTPYTAKLARSRLENDTPTQQNTPGLRIAFPNILLCYLGDTIDMARQIESRPAYLDHHLTKYANSMPCSLRSKSTTIQGSPSTSTSSGSSEAVCHRYPPAQKAAVSFAAAVSG